MVEDSRKPLLDQAAASIRAEHDQEQDKEKVRQMLPAFRQNLAEVIAGHVPPPEQHVVEVTSGFLNRKMLDRTNPFSRERDFSTKLAMTVWVGEEEVAVALGSTGYPDVTDPNSVAALDYKIDVDAFDYVLLVKGGGASLQSKEWESEPFTMHTPIDVPLPSWPAWTRAATSQDIEDYSALLQTMTEEGTVSQASTPPIIVEDYTGYWDGIEAERRRRAPRAKSGPKSISVHPRRKGYGTQ